MLWGICREPDGNGAQSRLFKTCKQGRMNILCKLMLILGCVCIFAIAPAPAGAAIVPSQSDPPELVLSMTGTLVGNQLTVDVHRTNTGFGLGGLAYDLQFSETLEMTRQYGLFGWVANDGLFDGSNPLDGASPVSRTTALFNTVSGMQGGEFPAGTSGTVEVLTFTNIDLVSPRWIYIDILTPQASNGNGDNLVTTLNGSINVIAQPGLPETHTFGVFVPEPATVILLGLGAFMAIKRRPV